MKLELLNRKATRSKSHLIAGRKGGRTGEKLGVESVKEAVYGIHVEETENKYHLSLFSRIECARLKNFTKSIFQNSTQL